MAAGPQRRREPAPHLLAHARGLELALQHRAAELGQQTSGQMIDADTVKAVQAVIADEFRKLAEELHHW